MTPRVASARTERRGAPETSARRRAASAAAAARRTDAYTAASSTHSLQGAVAVTVAARGAA